MKKILFIIIALLCTVPTYAQDLTLDFCVGTWKYTNSSTGEEFTIKLKKTQRERSIYFGGGKIDCLIGVYAHKKNGVILTDCLNQFASDIKAELFPFWATRYSDGSVALVIKDFNIKNGWGKAKSMAGSSRLYFHSQSPKQIRMILIDNNMGDLYSDERDIFPRGTSLPTDIVLTKIE